MSQFRYIADISSEELDTRVVIPCKNEQGLQTILIKNDSPKTISSFFTTDNLSIKLDKVLSRGDKDYFVHIIESKKQDGFGLQQFEVIYDYIFSKITNPVSSADLFSLISSLEEYFRMTPDPNRKTVQIGVFGELLTLDFLNQAGYPEILKKYHSNFFSKHDIEISPSLRLEVKSAVGEKRIHHFKHDQLYRKDIRVLVSSVLLEPAQEGLTLYSLFIRILGKTVDPDKRFALQKLMVRCGVSEDDQGLSFSEEYAISRLKLFDAADLPKIEGDAPKGISAIEYDVDCALATDLVIGDAIAILRGE